MLKSPDSTVSVKLKRVRLDPVVTRYMRVRRGTIARDISDGRYQ